MRAILWSTIVALSLAGCGDGGAPPALTSDPTDPVAEVAPDALHLTETQLAGQAVYNMVCWNCHGRSGHGNGPAVESGVVDPPPSFHSESYADLAPTELRDRFAFVYGEPDERHPRMEGIAAIMKEEAFLAALEFIPALAYPSEVPGSLLIGASMYGFDCAPCHGDEGRGDGLAAQLSTIVPADLTVSPLIASGDFEAVSKRVHIGTPTGMPPWAMSLSDEEIWDLVAYVASFQDMLEPPSWAAGM